MMATILPFGGTTAAEPMSFESPHPHRPAPGGRPREGAGDWEALMVRAQDGDRAAYHALLQAVTPYLRAIVRRYLGHGEDAEDALQEILLTMHAIRHTYERGRPFKPWLGTIASRRCIDLLRRRAHRLRHEFEAADDAPEPDEKGQGPLDTVARQEAARGLRRAVDALPERQREAVRLLRLEELSLDEAAARSGQSAGALKVACHRALKSLRHVFTSGNRRDGD